MSVDNPAVILHLCWSKPPGRVYNEHLWWSWQTSYVWRHDLAHSRGVRDYVRLAQIRRLALFYLDFWYGSFLLSWTCIIWLFLVGFIPHADWAQFTSVFVVTWIIYEAVCGCSETFYTGNFMLIAPDIPILHTDYQSCFFRILIFPTAFLA